jgi:aspartate racemase
MRLIGLIGGLSWESSAEYYRIINRLAQQRLGGVHSARTLMYSFDFGEIEVLHQRRDWAAASRLMADAARRLERGGADLLLICSNTMHRMADDVAAAVAIPLLHIADPTAARVVAAAVKRVGLLGTAFTMEEAFYKTRLSERHGLDVVVPQAEDRRIVHDIIYGELVKGDIRPRSREQYRAVIRRLAADGAEAIILGCTEIMLLVSAEDSPVPLFDTTAIHAEAAVSAALAPGPLGV